MAIAVKLKATSQERRLRIIYKYPLDSVLSVPGGYRVLHVGEDPQGQACVWLEIDTVGAEQPRPSVSVAFFRFGTGGIVDQAKSQHVGSYVEGSYVWHVYEQEMS